MFGPVFGATRRCMEEFRSGSESGGRKSRDASQADGQRQQVRPTHEVVRRALTRLVETVFGLPPQIRGHTDGPLRRLHDQSELLDRLCDWRDREAWGRFCQPLRSGDPVLFPPIPARRRVQRRALPAGSIRGASPTQIPVRLIKRRSDRKSSACWDISRHPALECDRKSISCAEQEKDHGVHCAHGMAGTDKVER